MILTNFQKQNKWALRQSINVFGRPVKIGNTELRAILNTVQSNPDLVSGGFSDQLNSVAVIERTQPIAIRDGHKLTDLQDGKTYRIVSVSYDPIQITMELESLDQQS